VTQLVGIPKNEAGFRGVSEYIAVEPADQKSRLDDSQK
jgi:hypothetical protein